MLESLAKLQEDFVSYIDVVEPVVEKFLNESNDKQVYINAEHLFQHIICITNNPDSNFMTIKQFLLLAAERWKQELQYQVEIQGLKNDIIEEFNKLCNNEVDEDFMKVVRLKRQQTIDVIFEKIRADSLQGAGDFCMGLIHGFQAEVMENFQLTAINLLCKPLRKFSLLDLLEKIQIEINKIIACKNVQQLEEATGKIFQHINNELNVVSINLSNQLPDNIEKKVLELAKEKFFFNFVTNHPKELYKVFEKIHFSFFDCVDVCTNTEVITKESKIYPYSTLEILDKIKRNKIENILNKIPFTLIKLKLGFINILEENFETIKLTLSRLGILKELELNLSTCTIGETGMKNFLIGLSKLKLIENLMLNLNYCKIDNTTIDQLAKVISEKKKINILQLLLFKNNITDDGLISMSNSLKKLLKITNFQLDLSNNKIEDIGFNALSTFLENTNNLKILKLDFGNPLPTQSGNAISSNGIALFSTKLKKLNNIEILGLGFQENKIDSFGLSALLDSITSIDYLSDLSINMNGNKINSFEPEVFQNFFAKITGIFELSLDFGKNCLRDDAIKIFAMALTKIKKVAIMKLSLNNNSIGDQGVNALLEAQQNLDVDKSYVLNIRSNLNLAQLNQTIITFLSQNPKFRINFQQSILQEFIQYKCGISQLLEIFQNSIISIVYDYFH